MSTTRREFIRRFGIVLASLLAARCVPASPDPTPTATATPVLPTSTPVPPAPTPLSVCGHSLGYSTDLAALLASSDDCRAPCWRGLRPGVSTEADFQALLATDKSSFIDLQYQEGVSSTRLRDVSIGMDVGVVFDVDRRIHYIEFRPPVWYQGSSREGRQLELERQVGQLALEDVLECMGAPERYSAGTMLGYHGETGLKVDLIYTEIGVIVSSLNWAYEPDETNFSPTCELDVTQNIWVTTIYFVDPEAIAEQLRDVETTKLPILVDFRDAQPWAGPDSGTIELTRCLEK